MDHIGPSSFENKREGSAPAAYCACPRLYACKRLRRTRRVQVSELPGSRGIFAPRWSPDGRYIIAGSHRSDKLMLYDFKNHKWRQLGDSLEPGGYGFMGLVAR